MESRSRLSQFSPQRDDFTVSFASSLPREFQRHYISREEQSNKLTHMRQTLTPSSRRISVLKKVSPHCQEFSGFTFVNLPLDTPKSDKGPKHSKASSISSCKTPHLRGREQEENLSHSDSRKSIQPGLLRRGSNYSFRNFDEELKVMLPEPPVIQPPSTRRPHKLKRSQINTSSLYLNAAERQEKLNHARTPSLNILSYGDSLQLSSSERAANFVDLFQNYLRKLKSERGKSALFREKIKAKTSVLNSPINSLESTAVHSHNISASDILLTNSSEGCCSSSQALEKLDSPKNIAVPKTPSVRLQRPSLPQKLRSQTQSQRLSKEKRSINFFYQFKRTESNLKPPQVRVTLKNGANQGAKFAQTPRFGRDAFTVSPPCERVAPKKELVAVGSKVDLEYAKENGGRKHRSFILALEQSLKLKEQCKLHDFSQTGMPSQRGNLNVESSQEQSSRAESEESEEEDLFSKGEAL